MVVKQVIFKEKELYKEGIATNGKPWSKYRYFGDDGEHYILFDNLDCEKPYQLTQKTRTHNGKEYTDWVVIPQGGSKGGGVKAILDRMEGLAADIQDIKKIVMEISNKTANLPIVGVDPELPF